MPEPPSSLVFCRKPAPRVCRAPNSVFCPEKPANSSPLNPPSPLVTASSPLAFWVQKCAKPGRSRAPSPQGFSRPDSPPRFRLGVRQPAEVVRQPAELVTAEVTAPSGSVFGAKKSSKRSSPKSPFFVSDCKWDARASKFAGFRWKAGSRRPLCSVFRFRAGKAANSSPPSMSPLVTASSPLSLGPKSAQNQLRGFDGFANPG